jgi:hypothetical protein
MAHTPGMLLHQSISCLGMKHDFSNMLCLHVAKKRLNSLDKTLQSLPLTCLYSLLKIGYALVQAISVSQNVLDALIVPLKTCKEPIHNAKGKVWTELFVGQKQIQVQPKLYTEQKQVLHQLMEEISYFDN